MARTKKAAPPADDELEELDDEVVEIEDEVEEVEDEVDDDSEVDGLTAKALAKLLGTDGRTVRKFLRFKYGKVGQGKRWAISEDKVDELKAEFIAFGKRSTKSEKKKAPVADEAVDEVEELDNDELEDLSDIEDLDDLELE